MVQALFVVVLLFGLVGSADAALTAPTLGLDDVETIAGVVIVFLGAVWGIRKAIDFFGYKFYDL